MDERILRRTIGCEGGHAEIALGLGTKGGSMSTVVKWSPFQELELLERRMRKLFDRGLGASDMPAADFYETDDAFVLELEAPGFEEGELTVDVSDHDVTIKGARKREHEQKEKTFYLNERLESTFERRFSLPAEADTTKLAAVFKSGVLELSAPKTPSVARTVEISTS
jgi:HSP20 family protein